MKLPLLISIPHAGVNVPPEVSDRCLLTLEQIVKDGDETAREIYDLASDVEVFVRTDIARAIVDMNRAPDDVRQDGVVKTHTIFNEPIYREPLDDALIQQLIAAYHQPYHAQLSRGAQRNVVLGVDCHTMLAVSPPIDPTPGVKRPAFCISNADGTCPDEWLQDLADCLAEAFEVEVSMNAPFRGGHIIRSHASELPWVQIETSRDPFQTPARKRNGVLRALQMWCSRRA